ncbi:MAG TPA: LirA/MavJ family T4SS effector [Gemmatimonas sp.]|uniref:LirA/MavJ family T4SS effector n=1 Tax=Gemmatimonas sp. TaxID=1962908 RepID=UPI002EDA4347
MHTRNTAAWGLSANAVCDSHWNGIRNLIAAAYPALSPAYLNEFSTIKVLMMDHSACIQAMQFFNDAMQNVDPHSPHGPRLSVCLTEYERRCRYPDFAIAPLGFVATDFDKLISSGYIAMNDLGAGRTHGKYTHRMQQHIVMRIVTNNFQTAVNAPWTHSPLDLYVKAGATLGPIGVPGGMNGGLPDHSTNLFGYLYDLGVGHTGTFGHPDNLFTAMRNNGAIPLVNRTATKNFNKRTAERNAYNLARAPYDAAQFMLGVRRNQRNALAPLDPRRIVANVRVGLAHRAANAIPQPASPEDQYRTKLAGRGYVDLNQIPNPDPFGGGAGGAPLNYGNLVIVHPNNAAHGVATPPTVLQLQAAVVQSAVTLDPGVVLPNSGLHGHP